MKRKENEEKEGVLLQGSRSLLTSDEADSAALPRCHHSSAVSRGHPALYRTSSFPSEKCSLQESCSSDRLTLRTSRGQLSVRGPRWLANRRLYGPNSVHRPPRLSRHFSTRSRSPSLSVNFESETKGWPFSPWTVSFGAPGLSENPKTPKRPNGANRSGVFDTKEAPRRHGRSSFKATSRRPGSMVASITGTHQKYEMGGVEGAVVGEEAAEHPKLVRYIGQPSRLSPARNPSWRNDQLKEPTKNVPGPEDQKSGSAKVDRSQSMANRLRASLRWRKPRTGEAQAGLRRTALRRSTTTVSDHMKTALTILPTAASFPTLATTASSPPPSPSKDTKGPEESVFHAQEKPVKTEQNSSKQQQHHHHHHSRKAINSEVEIQCENGERRVLRSTCDWNEGAINGDHLWCPTSASGDFCYVGEDYCCKSGARMKCSACKIIAHTGCIAALVEKVKFPCKPTFRDVGPRQYREQTATHHHWVHRRNQKGKCKQCGKGFQSKLLFGSKEIVAISCSWCKSAYHNKESCFNISKIEETCSLGIHQSIIVPPSWIVKLPRRGSFKSSLRKSPKKRSSTKRKSRDKNDKDTRPFAIKPIPSVNIKPLIVFINPKSGGNQGAKLMQKFQWLLNPRQVFDLTQGGPKAGLEMFRKVTNLRVLACGGDGTVGWVLSVLDQLNFQPPPAVAVLPLGTGNDLARALGWGGGYTDEPISKILCNIADGEVVHLDRWRVDVTKNEDFEPTEEGRDTLPLSVVNNYFSFGVDAHIALEFHEAREANPQKFNSRLRNKMFYGQAGGKDLLQRKWKDLSDNCTLECDGKDMTPILKENKVHAVVFLNIPSYGSGTHPWNRSSGIEQQTDDGIIEVIGLTTYQMPLLQAGGHGTTICQCKQARIITKKTIPMQVDGEAARVNPSIIELTHLNKASMVTKKKAKSVTIPHLEQLRLQVSRITMFDYEQHHYDKEKLRANSTSIGLIMIDQDADLEQVRKHINRMMEETTNRSRPSKPLSESWCFVDSCTAERFFRIDRAQEHLHYVTDICTEDLFVLDPELTDPTNVGGVRGDVSVDNDIDHSERLAMVSDSDSGVGGNEADHRIPPSALTTRQDSSDAGEEEVAHSLHDRVFGPEYFPPSHLLEKNSDGIIKAAKQGDLKMLKDLHSQGYSLLSIDSHGQTALHFGARHGFKDIVRYLIASAPASILDMVDNERGQTALHQAAQNRRRTVCCMLVAAGASLTIRDLQGNTPRALAQHADDQELAAYLESQEQFQNMVHEDLETTV